MDENNKVIIHKNLERILKASSFRNSKRNRLLLSFLVNETLAGNANKIKEYTIGVTVFEDLNFELGKSSLVRNQMVRLRKALSDYYSNDGQQDHLQIHLEKGHYVPNFIANRQKLNTEKALSKFFPLLAVLPFKSKWNNDKNDDLNEFFTDELTESLSAFSDLRVIANYSVSMFFQQGRKLSDFSDSFGLNYLLEGRTGIDNDQLSISLKLINTDNGVCTWSKSFKQVIAEDNVSEPVSQLINEICQTLAGDLGILNQIHQQKVEVQLTSNTKTYLYKALLLAKKVDLFPELYQTTETYRYLEEAINDFPENSVLHAHYAILLGNSYVLNQQLVENSWQKAKYHMKMAMQFDTSNQYVWTTQAFFDGVNAQYAKMRISAEKAISINPNNAYMVAINGWNIGISGFIDEGIELIERSLRTLPIKPYYFQFLYFLRAYIYADYALSLEEAIEFKSNSIFWKPLMLMLAYEHLNQKKDAEINYLETLNLNADFASNYEFYLSIFVTNKATLKEMVMCIKQVQVRLA